MAVEAAQNTSQFAGFIKPEAAEAYFNEAIKSSAVQQLVRRVPMGLGGIEIPVVTAKPKAKWVSEGGKKSTSEGSMALKTMKPHKIAVIIPVSTELARANPGGFMDMIRPQIAEAFALAFDEAVLHGVESPFGPDQHLAATTKSVQLGTATADKGGIFADLNSGLALLSAQKKRLTGFAFDATTEHIFNGSVDANGRPLFVDSPNTETAATVRAGRALGRPTFIGEDIAKDKVVGFGGDFSKAVWGTIGGISYDVSKEAAITIGGELVSAFEHNLLAIRAEAEFGWLLHDKDAFVKYTIAG